MQSSLKSESSSGHQEVGCSCGGAVGFKVSTAAAMKIAVFPNGTPCGSGKNRRFGGTYRLHHQRDKNRRVRNSSVRRLLVTATRATRCSIPDDGNHQCVSPPCAQKRYAQHYLLSIVRLIELHYCNIHFIMTIHCLSFRAILVSSHESSMKESCINVFHISHSCYPWVHHHSSFEYPGDITWSVHFWRYSLCDIWCISWLILS
jgi:hypothetical protein